MEDVRVEPLHAPRLVEMSPDGFMASASSLDESYRERAAEARVKGCVLRYVASVRDSACTAGLRDVPASDLMGSLRGTDNLVAIGTARYKRSPLVVAGAGAGREVTAAAVLWDIVSLARDMPV